MVKWQLSSFLYKDTTIFSFSNVYLIALVMLLSMIRCAYDRRTAPTEKECLALMYENGVDEHIIAHSQAVEKMVQIILFELSCIKIVLDKNTLLAAALLHDIARKEKNHADVGALKLKTLGYEAIGNIIATHMDIVVDENVPLNENELLFLADKLVSEDEVCGFEKRFEKAFLKCEGNLEAQKNIMKRLNATKMIINKIENLTGKVFHYG